MNPLGLIVRLGLVAGVGYVVFRLARGISGQALLTTGPGFLASQPPSAHPDLPTGKVAAFLGDPLALEQDRTYRMRFTELLLTPDQLVASLLGGFPKLTVYTRPELLPSDWPTPLAAQNDEETRFAEGAWRLPSQKVPRPQGLYQVWPA